MAEEATTTTISFLERVNNGEGPATVTLVLLVVLAVITFMIIAIRMVGPKKPISETAQAGETDPTRTKG
jgi:hypothetical protein